MHTFLFISHCRYSRMSNTKRHPLINNTLNLFKQSSSKRSKMAAETTATPDSAMLHTDEPRGKKRSSSESGDEGAKYARSTSSKDLPTECPSAEFNKADASLGVVPFTRASLERYGNLKYGEDYIVGEEGIGFRIDNRLLANILTFVALTLPDSSDWRKGAKDSFAAAASMLGNGFCVIPDRRLDKLRDVALTCHSLYPLVAEKHILPTEEIKPEFNSISGFNYRSERLLEDTPLTIPQSETVMDGTNGQVCVKGQVESGDARLWIKVYRDKENDLGFHADMMAGMVRRMLAADVRRRDDVAHLILMGCLLADAHAWKIHHYSSSPVEQTVDITPALEKLRGWHALLC
jgi:hypothetical protein